MGVSDNLQDDIGDASTDMEDLMPVSEKLPVKEKVILEHITYHYPNTEKLIFDDASIEIPVGKSIGIVGSSGAGKSTIVDVLLGLLRMQNGTIKADGVDVMDGANYRKWLKNVGYIPQSIFMLDDTIRKNVAFGVPEEKMVQVGSIEEIDKHLSYKRGTAIYFLYDNYQVATNIRAREIVKQALEGGAAHD